MTTTASNDWSTDYRTCGEMSCDECNERAEWLLGRIAELDAEVARLGADDPELDATDNAHPAWWRGHEHTTQVFCQKVNDILDGKDDGAGVANEPWESTRRRLLEICTAKGH